MHKPKRVAMLKHRRKRKKLKERRKALAKPQHPPKKEATS
jgi:hypothetical protein